MASNQDLSLWQKVLHASRLLRKPLILVLFGLLGISITWGIPQLYYPAKATPPPSIAQAQTPLDTLIQQANTSYEAGEFTQAETTWQEVVNSIPDSLSNQSLQLVQALSNLSLSQQAQANWVEAQKNINDALRILGISPPPAPIQINSRDQDTLRILAQSLDIRGQLSYLTGHPETALVDWQYSQQLYQHIKGYPQGKLNSLLNQAQAYQALGQYQRAEDSLEAVEEMSQEANHDFKIKVLQSLAKTERLMGKLRDANNHLLAARTLFGQVTSNADDQILLAKLELELGNVRQARAIRNRDLGKWALTVQEHLSAALQSYDFAIKDVQEILSESSNLGKEKIISEAKIIQLQGRLNQLSLRTTFAMELAENHYAFINCNQIKELVKEVKLLLADPDLPVSHKTVDARTHYAEILMTLAKPKSGQHSNHDSITQLFKVANLQKDSFENLAISIKQAHEKLKNFRAEANAVGRLGELYINVWESTTTDDQQQYAQYAYKTLEQAIALSTLAHAPDIRYRWHYQLGHLLENQAEKQEGTQASALNAYRAAIEDLRKVRENLLLVNSEVQFSFRDKVEPVYRDFIELLLTLADDKTDEGQQLISEALQQFDELQLAEINNFLGCNSGQNILLREVKDEKAGIIYMITTKDKIAIILDLPNSNSSNSENVQSVSNYKLYFDATIPRLKIIGRENSKISIEQEIEKIRGFLSSSGKRIKIRREAKELYDWLILPIMEDLKNKPNLKTLVFVPDGALRNLPMHVLFDGSKYLIQEYSVVISPRIELFSPKASNPEPNFFLGGFGEQQTIKGIPFDKIIDLEKELNNIVDLGFSANKPVIREAFTSEHLRQRFQNSAFSAVHLKAHGIFSSDPEETFLAGYQEPILGRDLGELIKSGTINSNQEIDLLSLSACQSAQGDNRAVLGLTGIAVRAGARSVISSLWDAKDPINTEIMPKFYEAVYGEKKLSRAESFQKILVDLIEKSEVDQPHEWATYILVGNWL
ncbi:MAG: CHAT domain-containing protein [Leptolyngbya sp. SIO3F4]|nr:CHAT domain-containing protein [Leptolyngbya sp. SIO3F4]